MKKPLNNSISQNYHVFSGALAFIHKLCMLGIMFQQIIQAVFPPSCLHCKKEGVFLCNKCLLLIPKPFAVKKEGVTALYPYEHPIIKELLWAFKYRGIKNAAKIFSTLLYNEIPWGSFAPENEKIVLIPIPSSKKSMFLRGYNHISLIARSLLSKNSVRFEVKEILYRARSAKKQTNFKERNERLKNMDGAFTITKPGQVEGKHIVILDDIITTGSTINEARRVLEIAMPASIHIVAIAYQNLKST